MALVLETGAGLTTANSYVSTTEAGDYFAVDRVFAATWDAYATQEELLQWASRVLDQKVRWRGAKSVAASGLRWPRQGMIDRDGNVVDDNVIPVQVKQATLEMAKYLLTNDPTTGQNVNYLKMLRVDVVELMWQDKTGQSTLPAIINEILVGFGSIANGGPRFVPILKT